MHYLVLLTYIFFSNALGHDYFKGDIKIEHPVLRMTTENSKIGAGYMRIINNSEHTVKLTRIEANIAQNQEIHEVVLENEIYKMRPLKSALAINPNSDLVFKPKSYHFMFFNINNNHEKDEMLKANLIFNNNIAVPIEFKVIIGNKQHKHN